MLEGNNERPSVQEQYAGAVGDGVSRVQPHKVGRTDLIAAAGMSQYRMGTALMRLMSEWQSGATPAPADAPDVKALAHEIAARRVEEDIDGAKHKVSEKRAMRAAVKVQKSDIELAHAEQRLLQARCADWHLHENKTRFQRMKTLPSVRAALRYWVLEKWGDLATAGADQIVADTIRHFLAPVCPTCQGRKRKVIQSRAIGAECSKCRGTGEADLQHGGRGRALSAYMKQCLGQAASDMREGAHRLRRSDKGETERQEYRANEQVEKLRRADAEAKADEAQDREAVADTFRASLGRPRKV